MFRIAFGFLMVACLTACSSGGSLEGHTLSVAVQGSQDPPLITQDDVRAVQWLNSGEQPMLRLDLKPEAHQRIRSASALSVGHVASFTWDGNAVADVKVAAAFDSAVELPAPPKP